MKFGPKEIKELNEYLRTGRNRKREFLGGGITFASDLTQPEPKREIVEIDAFNRFNRLYGKADGGRIEFSAGNPSKAELAIAEQVHGNKPEYKGKKGIELWRSLKQFERSNIVQGHTTGGYGGVPGGKLKKNMLSKDAFINLVKANKDKTYNEFVELIKDYKTKEGKPFTKNIVADRLRFYGLSGSFKKEPPKGKDPTKKAEAEKKRQLSLKDTDPTKAKGTPKFQYHHIRQIAGGVPLTTDDVAIIGQRMNSLMSKYDQDLNRISEAIQKNNKLALEAMNAQKESDALKYMSRVDELNESASKIVNSAVEKLPAKFKNYIGFNQFTLPRNEYGFPISNEPMIIKKVGGMPVSKTAVPLTDLTLEQEKVFKEAVKKQAEAGRTGPVKLLKNFIDLAPLPGPLKPIKKLFADGGRIGFMAGTIPGGYDKRANRYLKEIESDMHRGYQYYKRSGGKKKFQDYVKESMRKYFAGGGLLKQAGDSSGRPPEKGPNSQGLPGLLKRVRNL